jgi:hypothetical protein
LDCKVSCGGSERSEGDTLMTNRNLPRRLERLEERLLPPSEEKVLIVNLVSTDGETVGTKEFTIANAVCSKT